MGKKNLALKKSKTKHVRDEDSQLIMSGKKDVVIAKFAPLIRFIAQKIAGRLPACVELDDLISAGVIGLMDAIDKYDSRKENKFKTYAEFRIRGAMLDELRSQDWVPRSVREKAKRLERAFKELELELDRAPTEEEVASELDLSTQEYYQLLDEVKNISLVSLEDLLAFHNMSDNNHNSHHTNLQNKNHNPLSSLNTRNIKKIMIEAINSLPDKQKLVLSLYYYEELNLREIGQVLSVTESRVSQLHTQGIIRLKMRLKQQIDELVIPRAS